MNNLFLELNSLPTSRRSLAAVLEDAERAAAGAAVGALSPEEQTAAVFGAELERAQARSAVLRVDGGADSAGPLADRLTREWTTSRWPGRLVVRGSSDLLAELWRSVVGSLASARLADRFDLRREGRKPGPLVLVGGTGTGKTALARVIRDSLADERQRAREDVPFVPVNVAAMRREDLEARMRGTSKGAYTGVGVSQGWFEQADGGVLFLDEFQEAEPWFQAQLLDLLAPTSDRVVLSRVGPAAARRSFTVRTVIAMNRPVEELLAEGRLRSDFAWRVRSWHSLPGLDERLREDSRKDAEAWLRLLAAVRGWVELTDEVGAAEWMPPVALAEAAAAWLRAATWPGNYRQLERLLSDAIRLAWREAAGRTGERLVLEPRHFERAKGWTGAATTAPREDDIRSLTAAAMGVALRRHDFAIRRAVEDCGPIGMKSPVKFKAMLRELEAWLEPEIRSDPRVARYLD